MTERHQNPQKGLGINEVKSLQLVQDFTPKQAHEKGEFYLGIVAEKDQTFEGLIKHFKCAFQSGDTISELISDFMDVLKRPENQRMPLLMTTRIHSCKIIVHMPSFWFEANEQLKHQWAHISLEIIFYATIAHIMVQTSTDSESFTQFSGHLAMTFGGCTKPGNRTNANPSGIDVASYQIRQETDDKLIKMSCQRHHKLNLLGQRISSLEAENLKLQQLLDPELFVDVMNQAGGSFGFIILINPT